MELTGTAASTPVDLVVPVFNEAANLPGFFANLAHQRMFDGSDLPDGFLRIVVVDSESTDATPDVVETARRSYPWLVVELAQEPVRHHLLARSRGVARTLADRDRPILLNADVDTRFHPNWVASASRRLGSGAPGAVTCAGHFPEAFWRLLPRLTQKYYREIGTIFFPAGTIADYGFDESRALFDEQLFFAITRMPSDCGWALTKEAYEEAGGFRQEFDTKGREVVFEGRNLRFRLDRLQIPVTYANEAPFETSPRRLVYETEQFLAGTAYAEGLSHLREEPTRSEIEALESLAERYDFERLRRYVVKHYVVLPLVSRPSLVEKADAYLHGTRAREAVLRAGARLSAQPASAAQVHAEADAIVAAHHDEIVATVARERGLEPPLHAHRRA